MGRPSFNAGYGVAMAEGGGRVGAAAQPFRATERRRSVWSVPLAGGRRTLRLELLRTTEPGPHDVGGRKQSNNQYGR
jgi:hypothetical protein